MESNKLENYDAVVLASQIEMIKEIIRGMNLDYLKETADRLIAQGHFQDTCAVLNPMYSPIKSDLLRLQGQGLIKLLEFVAILKKCSEMKDTISILDANQSEIMRLFV